MHQRFAFAVALVLLALGGCRQAPENAPRPNIVLIVVDSLRQDHLSCYGYERQTSPYVDQLAARGVRYERAYSQAAWTLPSVASLLTSRFPSQLGIHRIRHQLGEQFTRLPELLAADGYVTAAVVSHYLVSSSWGFERGFGHFDESNIRGHAGVSSPGLLETASRWLGEPREAPFFLLLHFFDPHYAYIEHEGYRFGDFSSYDGPVTSGMLFDDLEDLGRAKLLKEPDLERLLSIYDSEIAFTDAHIGRLLRRLEELDLFSSSMIIFTADHGEAFQDHHILGHGGNLMEEMIRVPLIIKMPGDGPVGVSPRVVGLIDLFPTVLEAAGIAPPEGTEGRSLLTRGLLHHHQRPVFSESVGGGSHRVVVDGGLKLVHRLDPEARFLFDLEADPGERKRLRPGVKRERFEQLSSLLDAWEAHLEASRGQAEEVEMTEEIKERLRALSYLD